jgi:hypothetical protein
MSLLEQDVPVYWTHISMGTNSSVSVDLNLPNEQLGDWYYKIVQVITKGTTNGVIHLHSDTLSSNRSYNNVTYAGNLINTYVYSTSYTVVSCDIDENSYGLPMPSLLNNGQKVDFYLTDSSFASTSLLSFDFSIAVFKKKLGQL